MDSEHIIPPEWRPGFLLELADGGNDGCGNDDRTVTNHSCEKSANNTTEKHVVTFQQLEETRLEVQPNDTLATAVTLGEQKEYQEEDQVMGNLALETALQDSSRLQPMDVKATMQAVGEEKNLQVTTTTTNLENAVREPPRNMMLGKPLLGTNTIAKNGSVVDDTMRELERPPVLDTEAGTDGSVVRTFSRPNVTPQQEGYLLSPAVWGSTRKDEASFPLPHADEGKIRQLIDLSVDMDMPDTSRLALVPLPSAFERNSQLLKDYKAVHGNMNVLAKHCNAGKFRGLNTFLTEWRFKDRRSDLLDSKTAKKIRQLIDLGVDMERPPATLVPVFERNLQLLKDYKEIHGTVDVLAKHCSKGKFRGLNTFLTRWRSNARRSDRPNPSTAAAKRGIRQLIDLGVDMERQSAPVFERNFQLLKDYKKVHGTINVLAKHCNEGQFRGLNTFLTEWRSHAKNSSCKPDSSVAKRIRLLVDLGVELETTAASRVAFERNCQLLKEYKEVHGTADVLAKHCKEGKFERLDIFLTSLRFMAGHSHQPDSSTAKMIRQLVDLGANMGFQPRPGCHLRRNPSAG